MNRIEAVQGKSLHPVADFNRELKADFNGRSVPHLLRIRGWAVRRLAKQELSFRQGEDKFRRFQPGCLSVCTESRSSED